MRLEGIFSSLPKAYETALFRIAQESLTNVARHADAEHVFITLCCQQHSLHLTIRDDGQGYNQEGQRASTGIVGMRERATALGGTLTISSQIRQGTTIQAILPLLLPGDAKDMQEIKG